MKDIKIYLTDKNYNLNDPIIKNLILKHILKQEEIIKNLKKRLL